MKDYIIPNFLTWLEIRHPNEFARYPLTYIKVGGKLHVWMSPTIDELWEMFAGKRDLDKLNKDY